MVIILQFDSIVEEIAQYKYRLKCLLDNEVSLTDIEVIRVSQKLDKYINMYQKTYE